MQPVLFLCAVYFRTSHGCHVVVNNVMCIQAHSLTQRIHDVDLCSLDAKSIAEVRQFSIFILAL